MLACRSGHALATTTGMSVEPCEARREREFLLAMRELLKATKQRVDLCTNRRKQQRRMLACRSGHALATTTGMSVEPCEARREREFLLAMRELLKATEQRVDLCTNRRKEQKLAGLLAGPEMLSLQKRQQG
jgi:hypothetical protein